MKPILYSTLTEGTVPTNYGLGVLSDCIACKVTEQRNGSYELAMEYAAEGVHAGDIEVNRFIKAKPNFTDEPQLFRIYKVGKVINGRFEVAAQHVSYDLSGKLITTGSAASCVAACALLQTKAGNFTITTDKTVSAPFRVSEPSSVRSWFGGKAGSLLDVYGGEWQYNNYAATLKQSRGADRGVQIRYGKNLTDLTQEINMSNLCTGVLPYYIDQDGNQTVGAKVSTGLSLDVPRDIAVDFSGDVNPDSSTPILTQLANLATAYVNRNNLTNPTDSIELDFVQLSSLQERVDLCDTVHIYFDALGISASAKCIETVWDVLEERYTGTTFGDTRTSIADTIVAQEKDIQKKPSTSMMDENIARATKLITGNLGGYVVIHDSDGDGEPDEILIMNTADINTATKVWRWNASGLGYSSTGYGGNYGLAMTADGAIVADFITAGTLSGNRVRTGLISSANNALQIDLDNGTITAPSITLSGQDLETTIDSLVQTSVVTRYALSNSGTTIPSSFPLTSPTQPTEQQPFLWSRTVYTYADGQTNTSYTISTRGSNGTNGQDGAGLAILGNYETMEDLIADHPTGSAGQAYMVGTDLVVWNTQTNSWQNVGRIQGPSGGDGLWLTIDNNDTGTNTNVTYTAHLIKGLSNDVTTTFDAVFVWQMVNETGVTDIATGSPTITVARDSANYGGAIRCVCIAIVNQEVLQDYSYTTIQDYTGNDIEIIGQNNIKLIGEAAIYKPYAIQTEFQVLSDEISSKVSQTDFNSLEGTVTTQGTLIQQNADAILLKADESTVDAGLNGKMATNMSNRSSSILIDSGQIRFDSNSLVVNSSQFSLDANGNATFGGKLSAAELYIGGAYVGLSDAISDAESGAISTAATDATQKANNAQDAAINAAAADATTKANNAKNAAISTAASDATTKANNAKSSAISTAAADATTKANNALASAEAYADTGLATKVGNNEVRTKFALDNHSVTIESGTVKFKSNTLLIDSTQFTLDASGNATFKGNLSAATLNIGGTPTNIGTAISNAEADAISTAATDATTKANNAKNTAISTAATDATNKANNAKNSAISTAAADATTKANNALASAEAYADTGLATKVGNNEVRTKFAADEHSVTIESGTVKFKSNTLLIDSTQFTLDAQGNATFKGNLSAATLVIGGTTTNIGTAITDAESDAITAAAADATQKANAAKNSAISAAATDATTKANNAKNTAISTAATDATAKANNALNTSKTYTDTGLATKVGNNEIRTKFAADATSVTIESGLIAFRSNTFSVDSSNLNITNTGLVTASNFKAKGSFALKNNSDTTLCSIQAGTSGGLIAVGKNDTTQVATLQATSDGGLFSLADRTGEQKAYIAGATGYIRTYGDIRADGNITAGGEFRCKNVLDMQNDSGNYRVLGWMFNDCGIVYVYDSNNEAVIKLSGNTGNITCNAVIQTSSRKLKENIKPIEDSEKILLLDAVAFDYKNKNRGTNRRGFVAEEVAEILPNLVTPETEDSPACLDYISMIPYLQDVIKKQEERIKALEDKLEKLMEKEN